MLVQGRAAQDWGPPPSHAAKQKYPSNADMSLLKQIKKAVNSQSCADTVSPGCCPASKKPSEGVPKLCPLFKAELLNMVASLGFRA